MANDEAQEVEVQPKSNKGLIIVLVAVVVLLLAGGAVGFVVLSGNSDAGAEDAPAQAPKKAQRHRGGGPAADGPIVDLPGFVVNLQNSRESRYLKATVSVQLFSEQDAEPFGKVQPLVRNEILLQLSAIDLESVKSIEGKRKFEEELAQKVNDRLGSDMVAAVYFTEFVTQ